MSHGNLERLEARCLFSASTWTIDGIADANTGGASIQVQVSQTDPTQLQAIVNNEVVATRDITDVKQIVINGTDGGDDISVNLGDATSIKVKIYGAAGNDNITGGDENDTIYGGHGNDTIDGGAGNDRMTGGSGADELQGSAGNDKLWGKAGNDTLHGGAGSDYLSSGSGADVVYRDSTDRIASHRHDHFNADDLPPSTHLTIATEPVVSHDDDYSAADDLPTTTRLTDSSDLKQWWIDRAVDQYRGLFGTQYYNNYYNYHDIWATTFIAEGNLITLQPIMDGSLAHTDLTTNFSGNTANYAASIVADSQPTIHSTTNTQEANVDEADLAETDGQYLYTFTGNELVIVDVRDPSAPAIVSRTKIDGSVSGMYLDGNHLTIISQQQKYISNIEPVVTVSAAVPSEASSDLVQIGTAPTFSIGTAVSDVWVGTGNIIAPQPISWGGIASNSVHVVTYDVTDPASPQISSESSMGGSLISSRMIDGRLYLAVSNSMVSAPPPQPIDHDENGNLTYETEEEYRARLMSDDSLLEVPTVTTTADGQTTMQDLVQAPNIYVPTASDVSGLDNGSVTSIVQLDTRNGSGVQSTASVAGYGNTVYASTDSMYVASYEWNKGDTRLLKFDLGEDAVSLAATGNVSGQVLDQFSMSDYQGTFRIATSSGYSSNNIFTLQQTGDRLEQIGAITDIAPGEQIKSATFIGDRGYLVTFHVTDPLFTLDLSDPANPKIDGELVMPGYSAYLQPLSDTLLFGVGKNDNHYTGVKISLFDVSDQSNPTIIDTEQLLPTSGYGGAYSEVTTDSHALTWIADKHLIALPVDGDLELINVDATKGFTDKGIIAPAGDTVHRTIRIDNNIFAIGDHTITVRSMNHLTTDLATVDITAPITSTD